MGFSIDTTYATARDSAEIQAGYCCSECLNPTIALISVTAEKSGYIAPIGGMKKHQQRADQSASDCAFMMRRVLSYLSDPLSQPYPDENIELQTDVSLIGFVSKCPICGNIEPWQDKKMRPKMEIADKICIFSSLQEGYSWAQDVLRQRKNDTDSVRGTNYDFQQNKERSRQLGTYIHELKENKRTCPEAQRVKALKAREKELQEQLSNLSLFKSSKALNESIADCQANIKEAEAALKAVQDQADINIAKKRKELLWLSWVDRGLPDKIVLCENRNRIVLRFTAAEDQGRDNSGVSLTPLPVVSHYRVSEYAETSQDRLQTLVEAYNKKISG